MQSGLALLDISRHLRLITRDYGGFYTQDDIRELVRYAKKDMSISPEIDVRTQSCNGCIYPELSLRLVQKICGSVREKL
jgi:hypothetical protein